MMSELIIGLCLILTLCLSPIFLVAQDSESMTRKEFVVLSFLGFLALSTLFSPVLWFLFDIASHKMDGESLECVEKNYVVVAPQRRGFLGRDISSPHHSYATLEEARVMAGANEIVEGCERYGWIQTALKERVK